jgi:hypothetical protein
MLTFVQNPYRNKHTYSCIIFLETPEGFEKICQQGGFNSNLEAEMWGILTIINSGKNYIYEVFQE